MKFQVGDVVRVLDGKGIPDYTGGWVSDMKKHVGKCYTVTEICPDYGYHGENGYILDTSDFEQYIWDERGLELVEKSEVRLRKKLESVFGIKADYIKVGYMIGIKDVIFNNPATIILWEDGTKTVVKCGENDTYDPEKGMAMAICKKMLGNKGNYNNVFKKWLKEADE